MRTSVASSEQTRALLTIGQPLELHTADEAGALRPLLRTTYPGLRSLASHAFTDVPGGSIALVRPRHRRALHAASLNAASERTQLGTRFL